MSMIGHSADLSLDETWSIFGSDVLAEPDLLADLSPEEAVEYVGEIARDLGATTNILEPLRTLVSSEHRHDPYLVVNRAGFAGGSNS
ncbi:hypothetical protein [Oceanibium sediminis]|uniref:hypothetical protein n=1 Tax=Oceanibium sediminis TaxID=2026339 RepID=UPI0013003573|nr:hypothetical protein [Oceanibium sediminis]